MTTTDARPAAWIGAHRRVEFAQKIQELVQKAKLDEFPEAYWATIAEAQILADLARADKHVGIAAGTYIAELDERARDHRRKLDDRLAAAKAEASKACPADDIRCSCAVGEGHRA